MHAMGAASDSGNPQAALELLVLKTLARGPNHGFGIALHIETIPSALLKVEEGSLYPPLQRLERDHYRHAGDGSLPSPHPGCIEPRGASRDRAGSYRLATGIIGV